MAVLVGLTVGASGPAAHASGLAAGTSLADQGVATDGVAISAQSASMQAAATGAPVEVAAQTSETSRTLANPDGTFVTEISAGPVRVRRGGGWVPVDTTLEVAADGSVRPRATTTRLAFSGGGEGTWLAQIADGSRWFALGWSGHLPAPTLAGDTATYVDVLPGVDLQVTASTDSFSERLIVRDAHAGANPALTSLRFPVRVSDGLTVHRSPSGGFSVMTDAGNELFASPQPIMWDSSGDGVTAATTGPLTSAASTGPETSTLVDGGDEGGDGAAIAAEDSPGEGDQVATMALGVEGQSVSVTPSAAMLTSAATTFPVTIDPGVYYTATRNGWGMVNATYPTTSYWKFTGDEGMGYNTTAGTNKKRLFYMFSTSAMNSKHLLAATFKAYETFSYSCTASTVEAWETSAVYSSSTWNSQPVWRTKNSSQSVAYGRDGCSPGGAWVSFNVLPAVSHSKALGGSNTTIGLKASSETSNYGWKRFRYDATLSVLYNTPPATPTSLNTTSPTTSCVTGASRPVIAKVDPPTLNATINDSDGSKGQTVRGDFQVTAADHTTVVWSASTAYKAPGVTYSLNAPTLADGTYAWRVQAYDGTDASAWSGFCEFTVDGTAPPAPSVTTPASAPPGSCLVLPDAPSNDEASCGVGDTGSFTFVPGDATTTTYRWSLNSPAATSAATSVSSPDFTVTFTSFGPNVVRVWAYDAAGNVSAPDALQFPVKGAASSGWWRLDEPTGALSDISGVSSPEPLTRVGGTISVPGVFSPEETGQDPPFSDPLDHAIAFDGLTGSANSAAGVLVMGRSLTVAAWVKLDGPVTSRRYLVSQDQGSSSWSTGVFADPPVTCAVDANGVPVDPACVPFEDGRFGMAINDGSRAVAMYSTAAVVPGQWTHLIGVYNPGLVDAQMKLYVDGQLAGDPLGDATVPRQTSSTATGPVRVGSLLSSTVGFWWPGIVDEVQTFSGAYDDEQAARLYLQVRP
jgi:hypothetical protein